MARVCDRQAPSTSFLAQTTHCRILRHPALSGNRLAPASYRALVAEFAGLAMAGTPIDDCVSWLAQSPYPFPFFLLDAGRRETGAYSATPKRPRASSLRVVPAPGICGIFNTPPSTVAGSSKHSRSQGMYSSSSQLGWASDTC